MAFHMDISCICNLCSCPESSFRCTLYGSNTLLSLQAQARFETLSPSEKSTILLRTRSELSCLMFENADLTEYFINHTRPIGLNRHSIKVWFCHPWL
jgi:hypothetical protein